jgi:hypothetical protein
MIIMVISSHPGSEEMILRARRCTLRSSVTGPDHRQLGEVRLATWNVNSIKQRVPRLLPWLGYIASGVAPAPEQAVLIMPLSS